MGLKKYIMLFLIDYTIAILIKLTKGRQRRDASGEHGLR